LGWVLAMGDEPDIVKELREAERSGKLRYSDQVCCEQEEYIDLSDDKKDLESQDDDISDAENEFVPGEFKHKFWTIFENKSFAIIITDTKHRIINCNTYAEEVLNRDKKDLCQKHIRALFPSEEWKKIQTEHLWEKGMNYHLETKMMRKSKGPIDVNISFSGFEDDQGQTIGTIGIIQDISLYKRNKIEYLELKKKFEMLFNNSAVAITITDEHEKIISWNPFAEKMLGMKGSELYNKPVKSLYPPNEWKKIRSMNLRQKGMHHHLETKLCTLNQSVIDVDISVSVLKDPEGMVKGSIGIFKDISEQQQVKKALEESEKRFKQLYEKAPVPYHILSPDGKLVDVSEKWCQIFGYSKKEVLHKTIFEFIDEDERNNAQTSFNKKINSCKSYTEGHERTYITKKGDKRIFVTYDFFSFDKDNNIQSVQTIMNDITDRKKIEQQLTEKLEELERFEKVTVNRELKMIQLKKENKELKEKLQSSKKKKK